MDPIRAVALCFAVACCAQGASSQSYWPASYGGDGNAFWRSYMKRYYQPTVTTTYSSEYCFSPPKVGMSFGSSLTRFLNICFSVLESLHSYEMTTNRKHDYMSKNLYILQVEHHICDIVKSPPCNTYTRVLMFACLHKFSFHTTARSR